MILKVGILLFTLLFSIFANSQEENKNADFNQYSSSIFDSEANSLFLVSNLSENINPTQLDKNTTILIKQIGDYNLINASVNSEKTNLTITQNGINNLVDFDKNATEINQKISQLGDNNTVSDITYYTAYKVEMDIIQKGTNQNVQNIGTNSISKDMKIVQTGNGTSIIIINQ